MQLSEALKVMVESSVYGWMIDWADPDMIRSRAAGP